MMDPEDPPRLFESGALAHRRARDILEIARTDIATEDELGALEARLGAILGPPAAASGPGSGVSPITAPKAAALVKAGVAALVVAGAGATWIGVSHESRPKPPALAPSVPQVVSPSTLDPAPRPVAPTAAPEATGANAEAQSSTSKEKPQATAGISETELLDRAQAALSTDPALALSLAEKHRRVYPRGMLVQEREVIAIEALARLGRASSAKARADAFLGAYPGSAYRSKVEHAVLTK
jgi:hypothetical protein